MGARWKLGRALDRVERHQGARTDKTTSLGSLTKFLGHLGISKPTAMEAHRIGTLPEPELHKRLEAARADDDLVTFVVSGPPAALAKPLGAAMALRICWLSTLCQWVCCGW